MTDMHAPNSDTHLRSMRKLQYLTDTRVVVEGYGQEWQVHALMLASASTVFRHILEDVPLTGKPCSLLSGDNPCIPTDNQISPLLIWNTALCSTQLCAQQCCWVMVRDKFIHVLDIKHSC